MDYLNFTNCYIIQKLLESVIDLVYNQDITVPKLDGYFKTKENTYNYSGRTSKQFCFFLFKYSDTVCGAEVV